MAVSGWGWTDEQRAYWQARIAANDYTPRDVGRALDELNSPPSRADARAAQGLPRASTTATRAREAGAAPAAPADTAANRDALAMLKGVLADYGFSPSEINSLAGWAWGMITSGASQSEVLLSLRERAEFKAMFPEIEARQKAGLAPISPGEIVEYRRRARQMFQQYGLPPGFYDDRKDFQAFLTKDISLSELQERVEQGYVAATQAPLEVRQELRRFFGIDEGGLAAFFLDPERAQTVLMRQFQSAKIGGASKRTGFGELALSEADELADLGVTDHEAEQGFGVLSDSRELFSELVGQERTEEGVSRGEQLGAAFKGDAAARRKIAQQARRRSAVFDAGGGYASSREGFGGLGRAE